MVPGTTYIFAILIRESPDAMSGVGNFVDLGCHLMVEIGNHTPAASPTPCDVAPSATCGDRLGASLVLDAAARRGMLRGNLTGN
jgi:hypothetical protein